MVAGIVKLFPWHAEKGFEAFGTLPNTNPKLSHPNFLWLVYWWLQGDDMPKFTNNYLYFREVTWCVLVCKVKKTPLKPSFCGGSIHIEIPFRSVSFFWGEMLLKSPVVQARRELQILLWDCWYRSRRAGGFLYGPCLGVYPSLNHVFMNHLLVSNCIHRVPWQQIWGWCQSPPCTGQQVQPTVLQRDLQQLCNQSFVLTSGEPYCHLLCRTCAKDVKVTSLPPTRSDKLHPTYDSKLVADPVLTVGITRIANPSQSRNPQHILWQFKPL